MAYSVNLTITIAVSGTNPSGGGAVNETTPAVVWQSNASPAIRQSVVVPGEGGVTLTPPATPQPLSGYLLVLLPQGVDCHLLASGASEEFGSPYDCGALGQAFLLPIPNPFGSNGITLTAASECVAEVFWL